jgi:hypothetical protein
MRLIDRTGERIGRLLVVRRVTAEGWLCRCDCGREKLVRTVNDSRSCGCLKSEMTSNRNRTHGLTATPEYNSWLAMRQRCYYKSHKDYPRYGGRGIRVCDQWKCREGFPAFLAHVGKRPSPKHTIDRIDRDGHYEPGNVRWATDHVQSSNRSNSIFVTLDDGITVVPLKEAARLFGADYGAVRYAVKYATNPESPLDACKRLGAGMKRRK